LLRTWISILKCSNALKASLSANAIPHSTFLTHHRLWDTSRSSFFGVRRRVEHSSPATLQQIFHSIHPYKIPPVVAWTVSPIQEACTGWPCAPSISCLCTGKGVRPSSRKGSALALNDPCCTRQHRHHLTQSTEEIFARPVAAQSFQPRYPSAHPIDVTDVRLRSLLASPPSKTYQQINSSIRITLKRPPHSSEDQRDTPCAPQPRDLKPGKLRS
jgi:hypothetical protein